MVAIATFNASIFFDLMPFWMLIWGKHLEIQKNCYIFATRKQQAMRSPLP